MTLSQSARVIQFLSDGYWHTVPHIQQACGTMRLNSRISELRKRGYVIECERVAGEVGAAAYRYRMLGRPGDAAEVRAEVSEFGEQLDLVSALQEAN